MKADQILRQAADVIEERGKLRDKPDGERSMARAVDAFNTLTGTSMTELDGWLFMSVLKIARGTAGQPHLDDFTDLAGYAALAAECVSEASAEAEHVCGSICWMGGPGEQIHRSIVQPDGSVGCIDRTPLAGWKNGASRAGDVVGMTDGVVVKLAEPGYWTHVCCKYPCPDVAKKQCLNCGHMHAS